ncbi:transporter substrate-binding domain-containing protein [Herbiconiux sp. L3-i23]|uniref:transporter substrate-binding domain-containing protein n=1 Tax=Herbiconiux sp. L3-i23 TaxID=2905871 RepID=UPI002053BB4F|nr:transporter substrate-binding domain-containing protein [Herbiconiux sp. L3-i23]BDI22926.1 hypothetical protein L3i23_17020 [Herbiconiux sp. L3-i23]
MRGTITRWAAAALTVALTAALAGCSIPMDPEGTLASAEGGTLLVGVTENGDWVRLDGDEPSGIEPDLLRDFASDHDATIEWVEGSEQELIADLERGDLDILLGGFTDDTPWFDRTGMTRPYAESRDETGAIEKHVVLARMGENALLLALDRFLLSQDVTP